MNDKIISKFENQMRIEELNPRNTLIKAGFKDSMVLCDIGAGTGIFAFPASRISSNDIYALEIIVGSKIYGKVWYNIKKNANYENRRR